MAIAQAHGAAVDNGPLSAYSKAWAFNIPDPGAVTFVSHSYKAASWSQAGPCVRITGMTDLLGSENVGGARYTLKSSLGCTWGDSYPTGYGACDSSNCYGHNAGPWITSVHSGDGNSGNTCATECDLVSGSCTYSHRGDYSYSGTHVAGATSIWLR